LIFLKLNVLVQETVAFVVQSKTHKKFLENRYLKIKKPNTPVTKKNKALLKASLFSIKKSMPVSMIQIKKDMNAKKNNAK